MWKRLILMMGLVCGVLGGAVMPAFAQSVTTPTDTDLTCNLRIGTVGTTYYISSSLGDDENDGLTEDTAFQSFAPLSDTVLGPGDCVLLRRGDVWHERLTVHGSGSKKAWIFIGSYGNKSDPSPEISLGNKRDDICILVSDIISTDRNTNGFDYIWIDGIKCSHSTLGIYFRSAYSAYNVGVRVTNCTLDSINCPDLMEEALTSTAWLGEEKGNLPTVSGGKVLKTGGGLYEYIWPTAINFGGRPLLAMASVTVPGKAEPTTKVSEVELYQNHFENCIIAVGSNTYAIHYGTGPDQCYTYTTKWRVRGLTSENTMTMFNIDCADFGWDGTENSEWGIFEQVQALSGMQDCTMSMGTTQALFSACRNLYIRNSQFNGCRNNGQPDGCGFDFERSDFNFLLENCVFAENEGQPVLMMQTTMENQVTHEQVTTENGKCTLKNCLFYDNFRNVWNDNYKFDFQMFNKQNTDILITGCVFYEPKTTSGNAKVRIDMGNRSMRTVGPERAGVTYTDNEEHIGEDTLPSLAEVIEAHGMQAATVTYMPVIHMRDEYTGDILSETETETETNTAPENESDTVTVPETERGTDEPNDTEKTAVAGCSSTAMSGTVLAAAVCAASALKKKENES